MCVSGKMNSAASSRAMAKTLAGSATLSFSANRHAGLPSQPGGGRTGGSAGDRLFRRIGGGNRSRCRQSSAACFGE